MTLQADLLKAFGDFREDVGELTATVKTAVDDIAELKRAAQRERERAALVDQAEADRKRQEDDRRREGRRRLVLALISGSVAIIVAVIGAAAVILAAHG